ncbi:MAG: T9SS type A sorting domain-containing protein [Cyclobacteriaceae bacterium]
MKYIIVGLFLLIGSLSAWSQTNVNPTFEPEFFDADDEIVITYDVTGTALSNLSDAYLWMWVPDLSLDASSNVNPANSNTAATDPAKLTKANVDGRTHFTITLTPSEFLSTSQEISKIGMLLKGNDWSDGQTVDFVTELTSGFALKVEKPDFGFGFYSNQAEIEVLAKTSLEATLSLYVDRSLVTSVIGTTLETTHTIIEDNAVHELLITATTDSDSAAYQHTYTTNPASENAPIPDGMEDGINYMDDSSVTLVLSAPGKSHVFVIGDFNDWSLSQSHQMKVDGDKFWVTIDGLTPKKEYLYQYLIDGQIRIADPYAEKISSQFDDPEIISLGKYPDLKPYPGQYTSEAASYLQTDQEDYDWKITDFQKPAKEDLIIYELLVRDFTEDRSYQAVIDKLDYLDSLGINAIELMPVMEFEGNISWGYNPSSMFAVDKFYGTEDNLKQLIDEAHARGMAIIFDIVLNHAFGRNSLVRIDNEGLYGQPNASNPWLNTRAKHDFNVGYDFNHESEYTKYYSERIVSYWIEKYHIDGFRFDLSKGLTQKNTLGNVGLWGQLDNSRVEILKNIADRVWEADSDAYVILEHFADNSEEKILSDYGMMLWGNLHGTFGNAAKGSSTSLDWLYHETRGWSDPHVIGYFESHDEERLMWGLNEGLDDRSEEYRLKRAQLSAVFLLAVPGPKMIWQFGEFGYDLELNDDRVGIKPTRWEYLEEENRLKLFRLYQSLINLRTKTDYIQPEYFEWNTGGSFKWINIDHPEIEISIVGNFGRETSTNKPNIPRTGTWYNYLTGEPVEVLSTSDSITLGSGDFQILTSVKIENYISGDAIILSNDSKKVDHKISIYPNPATDRINLSVDSNTTGYSIRSLSGDLLDLQEGKNIRTIDVSRLKTGLYFIQLKSVSGDFQEIKFFKN